MKKITIFALFLLIGASVSYAQKQKEPGDVDSKRTKAATKQKEDKQRGSQVDFASQVQAELIGTIDAKKAKPGDEVVFRTTKAVKENGTVVIEKGSRLYGKLTEVTKRSKNSAESKVAFVLNRLENKELSVPITATVLSVTDLRAASSLGDTATADVMGSSRTSTRASSSGSSGGGGLLGGVTGTVNNTVGAVAGTATNATGSVLNTAGQTVGTGTQTVVGTVKGVQLSSSASGSSSSSAVLTAKDKDVRLEKGLMFDLMVQKSPNN